MKRWFNDNQGLPCMWRASKSDSSDNEMDPEVSSKVEASGKNQLKQSESLPGTSTEISATSQSGDTEECSKADNISLDMLTLNEISSHSSEVESTYNRLDSSECLKWTPPVSSQMTDAHSKCCGPDCSRSGHSTFPESHIYGSLNRSDRDVYGATALPAVPIHSDSHHTSSPNWGHRCSECRIKVQMEVEFVTQKQTSPMKKGFRSLSLPKKVRHKSKSSIKDCGPKKKRHPWSLKLNCKRKSSKGSPECPTTTSFNMGATCCVCPRYEYADTEYKPGDNQSLQKEFTFHTHTPLSELPALKNSETDGVEEDTESHKQQEGGEDSALSSIFNTPQEGSNRIIHTFGYNPAFDRDLRLLLERSLRFGFSAPRTGPSLSMFPRQVHMQVDYVNHLLPDLLEITNCGFYWGKMNRYEAEKLLENKPEGTFLLRDSAQEDYLFSVSFRRYKRPLHARIEQCQHKFSFDSLDPTVYSTRTVCGLIEYYKDPNCCKLFEPQLTNPLPRTFPFPLQHLCRANICSRLKYDDIVKLKLPRKMNDYLKEYRYKQRVGVRHWD